jgi:hypothetical protein
MLLPILPRRRPILTAVALASAIAVLAACGADKAPDDDRAGTEDLGYTPEYLQNQRQFIDSVIKAAPNVAEVAKAKGAIYRVATDALTAAVKTEAQKTEDCYTKIGLGYDPYLAGVATILVNFGAAGWDLVRVEDHQFSSAAGGAVVSCINARAKNEWALPTDGVPPGAHLVQLTFRPDAGPGERKVY